MPASRPRPVEAMLAIDTNILVRFLTWDHPAQAARATAIIESQDVFIPTTVWLETEWVLRNAFGFGRGAVADRFVAIAGLPRVKLEEPEKLTKALAWMQQGMDFADALHLAASEGCEAMLTFDKHFSKIAAAIPGVQVRAP